MTPVWTRDGGVMARAAESEETKRPPEPSTRVDRDNIPAEIRKLDRWVCWRPKWVEPSNGRPGRWTKLPLQPDGTLASSTNPKTWSNFETVVKAGGGTGFTITEDDDISGFDFDHVLHHDGKLEQWAEDIVRRMDTYTEVSPSGDGLRLIFRCGEIEGGCKTDMTPGTSLEIYTRRGRYLTITGNILPGTSSKIADRDEEAREIHAEVFGKPKLTVVKPLPRKKGSDDETVIGKASAAANGTKFLSLWNGSTVGYPSASEADLALANLLAYWTDGNREQVHRLLRQSGLSRPKWDDHPDYLERTITTACEFSTKPTDGGGKSDDLRGHRLTDVGNAERFARSTGGEVLWDNGRKTWLVWSGRHWEVDRLREVERRARQVARDIYLEGVDLAAKDREDVAKWAKQSESRKSIDNMLALARSEEVLASYLDQFDRDPWKLTVRNGTLDLKTCELGPHDPVEKITKSIAADYDQDSRAPIWERFLDRIFAGNLELIEYVQRAVGYSLTGRTTEQQFFFCHGKGRNGKSTLIDALADLLGPFWRQATGDLLLAKHNPLHGCELADLRGARLVTAQEAGAGRKFAETLLKQMTGGDAITARFMRGDPFTFRPEFKLWLAANHKPTVSGTDEAIWRRIHLIPFEVTIPASEVDRQLPDKLKSERAGILTWAVEGVRRWNERGLDPPAVVLAAVREYRLEEDVFGRFIEECADMDPAAATKAGDLFEALTKWLEDNGERQRFTQQAMGRRLSELDLKRDRRASSRFWVGIKLK